MESDLEEIESVISYHFTAHHYKDNLLIAHCLQSRAIEQGPVDVATYHVHLCWWPPSSGEESFPTFYTLWPFNGPMGCLDIVVRKLEAPFLFMSQAMRAMFGHRCLLAQGNVTLQFPGFPVGSMQLSN